MAFLYETSKADWQTDEDYNPAGADWVDLCVFGASYQEQADLDKIGHFRHRYHMGPWLNGPAPSEET